MYRGRGCYFKKLAHVIVGTGKSESVWQANRLEIQAGFPWHSLEKNPFSFRKPQLDEAHLPSGEESASREVY